MVTSCQLIESLHNLQLFVTVDGRTIKYDIDHQRRNEVDEVVDALEAIYDLELDMENFVFSYLGFYFMSLDGGSAEFQLRK